MTRSYSKRKPRECHKCGSDEVVKILYGYPSPEMFMMAEEGKIALGGCMITDNDPKWKCLSCDEEYYPTSNQNFKI